LVIRLLAVREHVRTLPDDYLDADNGRESIGEADLGWYIDRYARDVELSE
jgi:hypothetical protein